MADRKSGETASAGARSATRPRRARDSLSRDIIVAAAEHVAERDGMGGLTFQAIGEELGAHPTSIYRHFRDKDELLLELIDTLRQRSFAGKLTATDDWVDDLRRLAYAIHDHYMRYPQFAVQMAVRTTRRQSEFANVEFVLGALARAGFPPEEAALYSRAMGNLVRSTSSLEASLHALPPDMLTADELSWQVEYRQLDPERYPNITAAGAALRSVADPHAFETVFELFLESLERRARERHETPAPGTDG